MKITYVTEHELDIHEQLQICEEMLSYKFISYSVFVVDKQYVITITSPTCDNYLYHLHISVTIKNVSHNVKLAK